MFLGGPTMYIEAVLLLLAALLLLHLAVWLDLFEYRCFCTLRARFARNRRRRSCCCQPHWQPKVANNRCISPYYIIKTDNMNPFNKFPKDVESCIKSFLFECTECKRWFNYPLYRLCSSCHQARFKQVCNECYILIYQPGLNCFCFKLFKPA